MGPVSMGTTSLTGAELEDRVLRAASGFEAEGLRRGDGLAIVMRNDSAYLEASLAAGMLGLYPVPINWHCQPGELRFILDDSAARAVVMHADLWARLASGVPDSVLVFLVQTPPEVIEAYDVDEALASPPVGARAWAEWRDSFPPRTAPSLPAPQMIFYTSGTTGRPKGVKRPEMTDDQIAIFAAMVMRTYGLTGEHGQPEEIVTVATGPLYHGLPNGHAHFAVRAGARLIVMPKFEPEDLLATIERERVTHLALVPIMFNRLLRLPEAVKRKYDVSSLRFVSHAAAPVSPVIKREMIDWWGPIILEYYGSTEIANVAFCTSEEWLAHPGTVGHAPEGTDLRIVDDDGYDLPPRKPGHVVCRIRGAADVTYLNNDEARQKMELVPGHLAAGDIGYLDEDGFLFLCDRSKDMIISGGVNIYPAEIEGVLQKMPGVADCAVFGIPDDEYGEAVHAVVQPQPGVEIDTGAVRTYLRDRIASHQVPRSVDFADNLPREDSGKLFKRILREPFWAETGRAI